MGRMWDAAASWLTKAKTGPQLPRATGLIGFGIGGYNLDKPMPFTYAIARKLRLDPTIALARSVFMAPIAAGEWGIESEDDVDENRVEFIRTQFCERRQDVMEAVLGGIVDFGWAPFEKVFTRGADGLIELGKLKALLQDITTIVIDPKTGAFSGFKQDGMTGEKVYVPLDSSFLVSFQVEGTNWYGRGLMENTLDPWRKWVACNEGAARYDEKVAGTHWIVYYPPDEQSDTRDLDSELNDDDGIKSNYEVAQAILSALEANGRVAMPAGIEGQPGWRLELLSDTGGKQASFIPRLEYLDRQKIRAFLVPERAAVEGRFGTRADAETHVDIVITTLELVDKMITRYINWHVVDQLLALNWGDEARGTVWLSSTPLADIKRDMIANVFDKVLDDPVGFGKMLDRLDTDAMVEKLGLPMKSDQGESTKIGPDVPAALETELVASMRRYYRKAR